MLQVKNNYEVRYGGFSQAPKFPQTATLMTLLAIDKNNNDKAAKAMLQNTLDSLQWSWYNSTDHTLYISDLQVVEGDCYR